MHQSNSSLGINQSNEGLKRLPIGRRRAGLSDKVNHQPIQKACVVVDGKQDRLGTGGI